MDSKRLASLQVLDSLLPKGRNTIMATNISDCPLRLVKGDLLGTVLKTELLDQQVDPEVSQEIEKFTYHTKSVLQKFKKSMGDDKTEEEHAEAYKEWSPGPKTAEVPEFELIPKEQLISALDINEKLTSAQKKALEKILVKNQLAFSLDGRIGKYQGIKYEIRLNSDAQPVSLPPYHASPEKREAIDKQLDKWFSQDVIEPADSLWGAPVIVVY